jgi:molybdate transport system substrate-binding protein
MRLPVDRRSWKWLLTFPILFAVACNRGNQVPEAEESIIVFVAASTKDAVQEIASGFKAEKNVQVRINADDSSKLAMQIVQGAPAHVFLSANEKWVDFVKEKGFAQESTPLLGNLLVIVTPKGNPAKIRVPDDLTRASLERLAVAGPTVPAGIYARQALKSLELWDLLEADKKVVSGENVRVTLTYVERGEAEAGIVYATDAKISDKVDVVYRFPPESHDAIRYPLVLLKAGKGSSLARAFFDYLQFPQAKDSFAKYGFSLLGKQ